MPRLALALLAACLLGLLGPACSRIEKDRTADGRAIVTLWTSWAGIERKAIDEIIADYNASQNNVFVRSLNITDPQTKIMLATAGGNPPDLAIMNNQFIAGYAENNALTPLDGLLQREGIGPERFVKTFWQTAVYRDQVWALPLTCSVTTLHYNKAIFREVGLDPEQPPRTLEELERINDLISRKRDDGSIERIGHLPLEPGWWRPEWANWFGQGSFDGDARMLFDQPGWAAAADWLATYHQRFGSDQLIKLRSGFGRFSSPQNPFFTGKSAMVLQGIWMHNFVQTFAPPDFDYACAPFPASENAGIPYYAVADTDLVIIPKGAKRVEQAFAFMRYLASQGPMEKLARLHGKMTSLVAVSDDFKATPPPPLQVHLDIANSGYARPRPQLSHYNSYFTDTNEMVNSVTYGLVAPEAARAAIQAKQQRELDARHLRWSRVKQAYKANWLEAAQAHLHPEQQ